RRRHLLLRGPDVTSAATSEAPSGTSVLILHSELLLTTVQVSPPAVRSDAIINSMADGSSASGTILIGPTTTEAARSRSTGFPRSPTSITSGLLLSLAASVMRSSRTCWRTFKAAPPGVTQAQI